MEAILWWWWVWVCKFICQWWCWVDGHYFGGGYLVENFLILDFGRMLGFRGDAAGFSRC